MLNDLTKTVLIGILFITVFWVFAWVIALPVVFKALDGGVCTCSRNGQDYPSKAQCELIDLSNDKYEVITVKNCE